MKIETKFNVGQKVWWIIKNSRGLFWEVDDGLPSPDEIVQIRIIQLREVEWRSLTITYRLESVGDVEEQHLFLTHDEAQAECDKRNGGE